MRNLKKVLSLVLCMAVMMSVMVVGAGAAFTDQSEIVNTEAVDMCVALNIIGGYSDGSYKPANNVTRAEMTKMICVALNGGKEPVVATGTSTYTDTQGTWAEGYIASCTAQGIVSGVGNNKFNPTGNVTATEAAKMLLVALGYNAENAGYTGSSWAVNVNVDATQKGLYNDLEGIDASAALSRDNAAQMIWNALQAVEVEYSYTLVDSNGSLTSQVAVKDVASGKTLVEDKYNTIDTDETTGILTGISYNSTKDKYTYTVAGAGSYTTADDYTDLLGHNVTFVVKNNTAKDVYGAYASGSAVIVSGLVGDINTDKYTAADKAIKVDGTKYTVDSTAVVYEYGYDSANYTYTALANQFSDVDNYATYTAIDNDDDNKIDLIIVYPVTITTVSYVGSDYIKLADATVVGAKGTSYDDDYTVYTGAKKDDHAVAAYDTSLKTDGIITLVEKLSGKVTSYGGDNAVIDGTSYDYKSLSTADQTALTNALNSTVDFWVVNGYVVDVDATGSVDLGDYVLVTGVAGATNTAGYYAADLLFTDGTTATANVKKVDGATPTVSGSSATLKAGQLYTYEVSSSKYELTTVSSLSTSDFDGVAAATTSAGASTWQKADSSSDANAKVIVTNSSNTNTAARFASDAVVFVNDNGDYSVKTGADLSKVTDATTTVVVAGAEKNSNNAMTITFAYISTTGISSSDVIYGFVTSDVSNSKDSDGTYQSATIWNGSESQTLTTTDGVKFPTGTAKGSAVAYKLDADGAITEFVTMTGSYVGIGALTVIDGDDVTINGVSFEVDADDTTVLYVDKSENTGATDGSLIVANEQEVSGYYNNVYYYSADGKTLDLLIVDIDNDWNGLQ